MANDWQLVEEFSPPRLPATATSGRLDRAASGGLPASGESGALFLSLNVDGEDADGGTAIAHYIVRWEPRWVQLRRCPRHSLAPSSAFGKGLMVDAGDDDDDAAVVRTLPVAALLAPSDADQPSDWRISRVCAMQTASPHLISIVVENAAALESRLALYNFCHDTVTVADAATRIAGSVGSVCMVPLPAATATDKQAANFLVCLGTGHGSLVAVRCTQPSHAPDGDGNEYPVVRIVPHFDEVRSVFAAAGGVKCAARPAVTALNYYAPSHRHPLLFAGSDCGQVTLVGYHPRTGLAPMTRPLTSGRAPVQRLMYISFTREGGTTNGGTLLAGHGCDGSSSSSISSMPPYVSVLTVTEGDACQLTVSRVIHPSRDNGSDNNDAGGQVSCLGCFSSRTVDVSATVLVPVVFDYGTAEDIPAEMRLLKIAAPSGADESPQVSYDDDQQQIIQIGGFPCPITDCVQQEADSVWMASYNQISVISLGSETTSVKHADSLNALSLKQLSPWLELDAATNCFTRGRVSESIVSNRLALGGELFIDRLLRRTIQLPTSDEVAIQYPPRTNKEYAALLQSIVNDPLLDTVRKHALIYYVLREENRADGAAEDSTTSQTAIVRSWKHTKYARHFCMPSQVCALIDGYWCMDNLMFQDALYYFCDADVVIDWPEKVLRDLYGHGELTAALFFVQRLRPPLKDAADLAIQLDLLAGLSVHDAYNFYRSLGGLGGGSGALLKRLLDKAFNTSEPKTRLKMMDTLLGLPFDAAEQLLVTKYCMQTSITACHDFLFLFLLCRNKRLDMLVVFDKFSAMTTDGFTKERLPQFGSIADHIRLSLAAIEKAALQSYQNVTSGKGASRRISSAKDVIVKRLMATFQMDKGSRSSDAIDNADQRIDGDDTLPPQRRNGFENTLFALKVPAAARPPPEPVTFMSPPRSSRSGQSSRASSVLPSPVPPANVSPFAQHSRRKTSIPSQTPSKLANDVGVDTSLSPRSAKPLVASTPPTGATKTSWLSNPLSALSSFWTPSKKPTKQAETPITDHHGGNAKRVKFQLPVKVSPSNVSPVRGEEKEATTPLKPVLYPKLADAESELLTSSPAGEFADAAATSVAKKSASSTTTPTSDDTEKRVRTPSAEALRATDEASRLKKTRQQPSPMPPPMLPSTSSPSATTPTTKFDRGFESASPGTLPRRPSPQRQSPQRMSQSPHQQSPQRQSPRRQSPQRQSPARENTPQQPDIVRRILDRRSQSPSNEVVHTTLNKTASPPNAQTLQKYAESAGGDEALTQPTKSLLLQPGDEVLTQPTKSLLLQPDEDAGADIADHGSRSNSANGRYNLRHATPARLSSVTLEEMGAAMASPRRRLNKPSASAEGAAVHTTKTASRTPRMNARSSSVPVESQQVPAVGSPIPMILRSARSIGGAQTQSPRLGNAEQLVRVTRSISRTLHVDPSQDVHVGDVHPSP